MEEEEPENALLKIADLKIKEDSTFSFDLCSSFRCNVCFLMEDVLKPTSVKKSKKKGSASVKHSKTIETSSEATDANLLTMPINARKCTGCHLVLYCGAAHQKLDWKLHSALCKVVQRVCSTFEITNPYCMVGAPTSKAALARSIFMLKGLIRVGLDRPLHSYEDEIISYPTCCAVCCEFNNVRKCRHCQAVGYCSEEHAQQDAEKHRRECGLLRLYYCTYKTRNIIPDKELVKDLYCRLIDMKGYDLFSAFERVAMERMPAQPDESLESYQLYSCAADFSCIMTICYCITLFDIPSECNRFVIYIVGATMEHELWFRQIHTKFFFLQYPQITQLVLYFVGLDLYGGNADSMLSQEPDVFKFKGTDRTVHTVKYRGSVQDFLNYCSIQPSLMMVFNCGFSEFSHLNENKSMTELCDEVDGVVDSNSGCPKVDPWYTGIAAMLQITNAPLFFTSFTKLEAEFDKSAIFRVVQDYRIHVSAKEILDITNNPYRDLRPLRRWSLDESDIYYRNNYVQGVIGKPKS